MKKSLFHGFQDTDVLEINIRKIPGTNVYVGKVLMDAEPEVGGFEYYETYTSLSLMGLIRGIRKEVHHYA